MDLRAYFTIYLSSLDFAEGGRPLPFENQQIALADTNQLRHSLPYIQILNFIPLSGSLMLHVTSITPLLQWITLLTLSSNFDWNIMGDVGDKVVLVGQQVRKTGGDEVKAVLEKIILFDAIDGKISASIFDQEIFEFFCLWRYTSQIMLDAVREFTY